LRHRSCDGTPNGATVSVTAGRVALLTSKNIVIYLHTPQCGTWWYRDSASRYSYGVDHSPCATEGLLLSPQSTYFPRDETGLVCLPTQLERTLQLYTVMPLRGITVAFRVVSVITTPRNYA
jgi:hypothetical protein